MSTVEPLIEQPPHEDDPVPVAKATPAVPQALQVDREALRAAGMLSSQLQDRLLADQYRRIKRPLLANAFGKSRTAVPYGRAIMVASALPGEGKTFSSVNLALSMALDPHIDVVLVDADVPKPHVSDLFGMVGADGLMDALVDEAIDPESLVLPCDVNRLSFLPAGHSDPETASELLESERMGLLIDRLLAVHPNRVVLFDSSPLLLTSESHALATAVGQVVLVVRASSTPRQAVLDAIATLPEGKPVGLVLNQSESLAGGGYYGYYGYGDYGKKA